MQQRRVSGIYEDRTYAQTLCQVERNAEERSISLDACQELPIHHSHATGQEHRHLACMPARSHHALRQNDNELVDLRFAGISCGSPGRISEKLYLAILPLSSAEGAESQPALSRLSLIPLYL